MGVTNFFTLILIHKQDELLWDTCTLVNSFSDKKIVVFCECLNIAFLEQIGNYPHLSVCIIKHSLHTNPFYKKNINFIVLICLVMFEISQITIHANIANSLFKNIARVIFKKYRRYAKWRTLTKKKRSFSRLFNKLDSDCFLNWSFLIIKRMFSFISRDSWIKSFGGALFQQKKNLYLDYFGTPI